LPLPNVPLYAFRTEAKLPGTEADGKGQLIGMAVQPVFWRTKPLGCFFYVK
jgi:hypothetical protein